MVDIVVGLVFLSLFGFFVILDKVVFMVNDGVYGFEVWVFDLMLVGLIFWWRDWDGDLV